MDYIEYIKSLPSCLMYSDDSEYREKLRMFLRFDKDEKFTYNGKITKFSDLDEITQDELLFDSKNTTKHMDILYEITNKEHVFREIYIHAAARMFSEDPKIGQAVVCSYDTFRWYYASVWYFLNGGISGLCVCPEIKKLKNHFSL